MGDAITQPSALIARFPTQVDTNPEVLPTLQEGQTFHVQNQQFQITQICGETAYIKRKGANWDTPIPTYQVQALVLKQAGEAPPLPG